MKKKTVKKLVLAKETVRSLDPVRLRSLAGGYSAEWTCQYQTNGFGCYEPQSRHTNCFLCAP